MTSLEVLERKVKVIAGSIYRKIPKRNISFEDLEQAGWVGALEALKKYESGGIAELSTYAGYRIRGSILDWLRDNHTLGSSYVRAVKQGDVERIPIKSVDVGLPVHCDYREKLDARFDVEKLLALLETEGRSLERRVLQLRYLEGLSHCEIAEREVIDKQIIESVLRSAILLLNRRAKKGKLLV